MNGSLASNSWDMRDAITDLAMRPEVDPTRIGLWGTSYAGGHAIVVAAVDRRVRCVVSLVPTISGHDNTVRAMPADRLNAFQAEIALERCARARGEPPRYVPISEEGSESFQWSQVAGKGTSYVNAVTLLSRDLRMAYAPGAYLPRVAPTPLLMVVASRDTRCLTDVQLAAYSRAHEPKQLVVLPGGHYDPYLTQLDASKGATAAAFHVDVTQRTRWQRHRTATPCCSRRRRSRCCRVFASS